MKSTMFPTEFNYSAPEQAIYKPLESKHSAKKPTYKSTIWELPIYETDNASLMQFDNIIYMYWFRERKNQLSTPDKACNGRQLFLKKNEIEKFLGYFLKYEN